MDEEEDEDNFHNICGHIYKERFILIKSNMWKFGNRNRLRTNLKIYDKFLIILFAVIFSNFRLTYAVNVDFFNSSHSHFNSISSLRFEELDNYSQAVIPQRRIRHDTFKDVMNNRLISFKLEPSLPSEFVDSVRNSSVEYTKGNDFNEGRINESENEEKENFIFEKNKIMVRNERNIVNFPTPIYNENCLCTNDREQNQKIIRISHDLTVNIQHRILDTSEGITTGVIYQVKITSIKKFDKFFISSEDVHGLPIGMFLPSHKLCSNVIQFYSNKLNDSQILLNWSLPTKINNSSLSHIVFRLCYNYAEHNHAAYEVTYNFPVFKGCEFHLWPQKGSLSSTDLYNQQDDFFNCSIIFSNIRSIDENFGKRGIIIKLTRLNIKCNKGNITFSFNTSALLCGKLEEIPQSDREYYFPPVKFQPRLIIVGKPIFAITYELVDFCYNITLIARNDSVVINPLLKIFCNYQISLPYGYRIDVSISIKSNIFLQQGNISSRTLSMSSNQPVDQIDSFLSIPIIAADSLCEGIFLQYWDGNKSNVYCVHNTTNIQNYHFRFKSDENQIRLRIWSRIENEMAFYLFYTAFEVPDIVRGCPFGSIYINLFCVTVIDNMKLDWHKAEEECVRRGGHLASIVNEQSMNLIDKLLMKSPRYRDYNSYWIGASDVGQEGEYKWANSLPFLYTNWFSGWASYGYYNRQPNDDGFSSQDCIELRRQYHISPVGINANGSKIRLTPSFTWNDRDCRTDNYFLCEFPKTPSYLSGNLPDMRKEQCNQKLVLNEDNDGTVISSPNFPHNYLDNKNCLIYLTAPLTHKIVIIFEEFVLEEEPNCSYDYLEIYENSLNNTNSTENIRRYCGDWSDKLKLLRYVSAGSKLHLRFVSDYSHSFSGYKAHISIEQVKTECQDNRLQLFNSSCYLFVSYPQVTWQTAQDICSGMQGNLASIHSLEEEHFVVAKIRESHEYTTSTIYWLGGKYNIYDDWKWVDNTSIIFNAWVPIKSTKNSKNNVCLGIQWIPSPSSLLPSGLYWVPIACQKIGGYVCKILNRQNKMNLNLNATFNGTEGEFNSPNFPGNYYHNLDYWVTIIGPENTRIIIQFHTFDLEDQKNCLYDYLEIYNTSIHVNKMQSIKYCGHYISNSLHRLNFVSSKNEIILRFHSDYSITGSGFSASWKAVDISGCPTQTLTAKEGIVTSPNYPNFLLANLQCTTTILAPVGRQIWFELTDCDLNQKRGSEENIITESDLYLFLNNKEKLYPLQDANVLTDGIYLSYGEFMRIYLKTVDAPNGRGFRGTYKTISELNEARVIYLGNNTIGNIYHLNFPLNPVPGLNFVQRFVAPLGYLIHVQFHQVVPSSLGIKGRTVCQEEESKNFIEVRDHYADRNGTWWQFCEATHGEISHLAITSYLNTITIKQISDSNKKGVLLNASLSVIPDPNFKTKILQFPYDYVVEYCIPNPCYNNGKCISDEVTKRCECINHFTGLFCALTICDMNPCVFGICELTSEFFRCNCQSGYQGQLCDKKIRPCSMNPCQGRGDCIEKNNFTFFCQCHAWWEGERCDKKIANIPYKPLTDRMLEEPFWLGLLTVFIVLSCIGLVWCARRHFPEKLEKLLAEEAERNRSSNAHSGRATVSRSELTGQNGIATAMNTSQTTTANSSPNPKTLLGRIGIRKPSLFSLSSSSQPTHTARTFSLDDLFKQSSSRSQMSYKHRNSSGYLKKSTDKYLFKKQFSSTEENKMKRVKKIETIELKEDNIVRKDNQEGVTEETSFISPRTEENSDKSPAFYNKHERKVHFTRLLNKIQAEISSNSNIKVGMVKEKDNEMHVTTEKPLTASAQTLIYQPKSPHSTSANQGSDSLSSSEMTLISASGEKLNSRRPSLLTLGTSGRCQKAASADSILAMFRKYSINATECNSNFVSASTSPTISSPVDEAIGSDDSSLSSYQITSSGMTESPICANKLHQSTIQIAVVDPLNSQKQNSSIASSNLLHPPTILLEVPNKCLSPIHEVPTPSPSPSMTPIMSRHHISANRNKNTSNFQTNLTVEQNGKSNDEVSAPTVKLTLPLGTTAVKPYHLTTSVNNPASIESSMNNEFNKNITNAEYITPILTIQEPSPLEGSGPTIILCPETPPAEQNFCMQSPKIQGDKSFNTDLCSPPIITVTYTGDIDSDTDCSVNKCNNNTSNTTSYLSPFSMCSRADRTASESNLSSSGYSSMASPGPSRCGSSNPLCPLDGDDQGGSSHHSPRKPSPLLRTPSGVDKNDTHTTGQPSDSETLSDDHQMESNDEGFSTDQLDEKIKEGEVKSAKELELFIENEHEKKSLLSKRSDQNDFEPELNFLLVSTAANKCAKLKFYAGSDQNLNNFKRLSSLATVRKQSVSAAELLPNKNEKYSKSTLQLPSIVVDTDLCRSPVSSRSESPLSDRTAGLGRFSPMFYGRLTDSDGIYDWTSSDCLRPNHRKHFGRRRERHRSKSPHMKAIKSSFPVLLDVSGKITSDKFRKPSPKRRFRSHQLIKATSSSSSSSECTESHSKICLKKLNSPYKVKYYSKSSTCSTTDEISVDEITENYLLSSKFIASRNDTKKSKNYNIKKPSGQRFSFINKLNFILSNEKKAQWKTCYQDSASIPLLIHSHSVEENKTKVKTVPNLSKNHLKKYSKRGFFSKSSGLTD